MQTGYSLTSGVIDWYKLGIEHLLYRYGILNQQEILVRVVDARTGIFCYCLGTDTEANNEYWSKRPVARDLSLGATSKKAWKVRTAINKNLVNGLLVGLT